jgi:hypothetical protein
VVVVLAAGRAAEAAGAGVAERAGVVTVVVVEAAGAVPEATGPEAKAGAAATRSALASIERRSVIWSVLPAPSGIGAASGKD